jgi:hypothetical protein
MLTRAADARCSECDGLRKKCSDALAELLRILAERDAARKRQDHDLVEAFEEIETESLERCEKASQAVYNHEVTHIFEDVRGDCDTHPTDGIEAAGCGRVLTASATAART